MKTQDNRTSTNSLIDTSRRNSPKPTNEIDWCDADKSTSKPDITLNAVCCKSFSLSEVIRTLCERVIIKKRNQIFSVGLIIKSNQIKR